MTHKCFNSFFIHVRDFTKKKPKLSYFGKLGAVDIGFVGLEETDGGEEEEVIGVLVGAVAGFVAIFEEVLTEVACPAAAELTLLLLRPRVASALDNDSLLKFRKPLRLFGNGGKPSIFVYALLFTTFASIACPQPQNFLL